MSRESLAELIKEMRLRRSWSQSQLAEIAVVSLRTVQRLETSGMCSHETLLSIAAAFDIDVQHFTDALYDKPSESRPQFQDSQTCGPDYRKLIMREERTLMAAAITRLFQNKISGAGLFYLAILAGISAFGMLNYQELYGLQAPLKKLVFLHEDAALSIFEKEYRQFYEPYGKFIGAAGFGLALYLGIWAAIFGLWRRSYFQGMLALALGGGLTILSLSLLPWMYFPLDRYPVSALWFMGNIGTVALSFLFTTVLGRFLLADRWALPGG